jgi:hypothetical protein
MGAAHRVGWAALTLPTALALAVGVAGCGTPGAPQPPSLNLPNRVTDLAATRSGSQVSLTFTMPKKNTDRLLLKGAVAVRVCRRQGKGECETAGSELQLAPGATGEFTDTLPPALASGTPRELTYFVELKNRNGRSAGLSNGAAVLAGNAPDPIAGLRIAVRRQGVELNWAADSTEAAVRLRRTLLTPPQPRAETERGPLALAREPLEQNLLVERGSQAGGTLDKTARTGETYEYRAQRVVRATVDGQTLELAGELSLPVRAEVLDIFPPAVPAGLAAVATAPEAGSAATQPSIDLSWQPVADADLAGYIVYRREGSSGWQRISPEGAQTAPAFHDAKVAPGHTYLYSVSAMGRNGHESPRSAEAQETAPGP